MLCWRLDLISEIRQSENCVYLNLPLFQSVTVTSTRTCVTSTWPCSWHLETIREEFVMTVSTTQRDTTVSSVNHFSTNIQRKASETPTFVSVSFTWTQFTQVKLQCPHVSEPFSRVNTASSNLLLKVFSLTLSKKNIFINMLLFFLCNSLTEAPCWCMFQSKSCWFGIISPKGCFRTRKRKTKEEINKECLVGTHGVTWTVYHGCLWLGFCLLWRSC